MSTQTDNGRAFEWAIGRELSKKTNFPITKNSFSINAESAFNNISSSKQQTFKNAAENAIEHILKKETKFFKSKKIGAVVFNTDAAGKNGDVRDVLLELNGKQLGISCKNNHEALKHSRLSATVDFIKKWNIDIDGCSLKYWNKVKPIFKKLKDIKTQSNGTFLWADIVDKPNQYYWPLLDAWADEINDTCAISIQKQSQVCKSIILYLIGKHDFYKVICEGSQRVHIQAYNFNNTLSTKRTNYPDSIIAINKKNGGQYSKTIVFNHGYSINFRIHSASSRVEPSLKFDITAIGLPTTEVYQQTIDI